MAVTQKKKARGRPPKSKRDIYLPREGFTKREQLNTLRYLREAQYRLQGGMCSCCNKPMDLDRSAWLNCRGGPPLSKWAFCDQREFNPVSLCHTFHPRSPAEIEAEYMTRAYELIRQSCVFKCRNTRWGTAGHTKGQMAAYEAILKEHGFGEREPDPATACQLWIKSAERMEAQRLEHLTVIRAKAVSTMKRKNPEWGTGAWRYRKPAARPLGLVKETANYRTPEPALVGGGPAGPDGPVPVSTTEDVLAAGREMDDEANTPFARYIADLGAQALREAQARARVAG